MHKDGILFKNKEVNFYNKCKIHLNYGLLTVIVREIHYTLFDMYICTH
jgi:hypothetical protein